MTSGPLAYLVVAGLVVLCAFFAWMIGRYGVMFYREARGARKLSTLAGAAAVIAIIVNILVGVFTQAPPVLTPPPAKPAPHLDGVREPPRANP